MSPEKRKIEWSLIYAFVSVCSVLCNHVMLEPCVVMWLSAAAKYTEKNSVEIRFKA